MEDCCWKSNDYSWCEFFIFTGGQREKCPRILSRNPNVKRVGRLEVTPRFLCVFVTSRVNTRIVKTFHYPRDGYFPWKLVVDA